MEPQTAGNTAVIAATAAAAIAFLANVITTIITFAVAKLNYNKDINLQNERIREDTTKSEVALLRLKLEEVHLILSKIALENSQTISFFHSTSGASIAETRKMYLENCERVHKAACITDLYFDEFSQEVRSIYCEMHMFWGYQETLLMTNHETNQNGWDKAFAELLAASNKINTKAQNVQYDIARKSKELSNMLMKSAY